jgi:hypothetical protein
MAAINLHSESAGDFNTNDSDGEIILKGAIRWLSISEEKAAEVVIAITSKQSMKDVLVENGLISS